MTLIQSAPIKDRMPSATLRVNELIKLDQAMMVRHIFELIIVNFCCNLLSLILYID